MFGVIRNVSVPFGAPSDEFGIDTSEHQTVADLTNRRSFFKLATSASVIWAELAAFNLDLDEEAPVIRLDPNDFGLCGDVSTGFVLTDAPFKRIHSDVGAVSAAARAVWQRTPLLVTVG